MYIFLLFSQFVYWHQHS